MLNKWVFQIDSPLINAQRDRDNYLVDYTDGDSKVCAIYFSSHNIYYPNDRAAFQEAIITKDKYEWYGTRIKKASKHIFIRDIFKQWYLRGINNRLNTIPLLLEWLKKETRGYEVYTVGSSAGGYAAVLFGYSLNAERIISFNGQFILYDLLSTSTPEINPILFQDHSLSEKKKLFDLNKMFAFDNRLYYYYSNKSSWDLLNRNSAKLVNSNVFGFKVSNHGIPFPKEIMPLVLNGTDENLLKLRGERISPFLFMLHISGFSQSLRIMAKMTWQYIRQKIGS